jgi:hypothetical protein
MDNTTNTGGFGTTTYTIKPSKADIIQRLLESGHITVEEAMTLMTQDQMPMPVMPYYPPYNPTVTHEPGHPLWYSDTKFPTDQ